MDQRESDLNVNVCYVCLTNYKDCSIPIMIMIMDQRENDLNVNVYSIPINDYDYGSKGK